MNDAPRLGRRQPSHASSYVRTNTEWERVSDCSLRIGSTATQWCGYRLDRYAVVRISECFSAPRRERRRLFSNEIRPGPLPGETSSVDLARRVEQRLLLVVQLHSGQRVARVVEALKLVEGRDLISSWIEGQPGEQDLACVDPAEDLRQLLALDEIRSQEVGARRGQATHRERRVGNREQVPIPAATQRREAATRSTSSIARSTLPEQILAMSFSE